MPFTGHYMTKDTSIVCKKHTNGQIMLLMNAGVSLLCVETGFLSMFVFVVPLLAESVSQPYIDHMFAWTRNMIQTQFP